MAKESRRIKKVKSASRKIKALEKKIDRITMKVGITVDSELEGELLSIMNENMPSIEKEPEDSFRRILWQQQLQNMKKKMLDKEGGIQQ